MSEPWYRFHLDAQRTTCRCGAQVAPAERNDDGETVLIRLRGDGSGMWLGQAEHDPTVCAEAP